MKNSITKLFVYGSLRNGFHHSAYEYISKHFRFLSEAKVRGHLYDMGEYPAAIHSTDQVYITGELYELAKQGEFDWAIEQLDDYEGLNPEEGETPLFRREPTEVLYNHHSSIAWMYWFNREVAGRPLIPSGDIFDHPNYKSKK